MGKISLVMNAPANGKWQFSTLLNFEKSKTKSDLFMLFSKIGHQIDYLGKIEINSKFRPCRQMILEIYRDWLLILVRRWLLTSPCMDTCGCRFRRLSFIKSLIFLRNRRLNIKNCFSLLALLVFELHFHFGSNTKKIK